LRTPRLLGYVAHGLVLRLAHHLGSNAVAYLAIFVALGGTSYAAITIPNNSVGNKQLKKDAVDTKKVKNKTLLADDVKAGQAKQGLPGVAGAPGNTGSGGVQGLKGEKGDKGDLGDQGVPGADIKSVSDPTGATDPGAADTVQLQAPALETAGPTRLHAFATGSFNGSATVSCVIKVSTDGAAKIAMGQRVVLSGTGVPFTAPGGADGAANVPAGSHVVTFECQDGNDAGGQDFLRGDLTVSKAAQ
jgi:hypothetical protein